MVWPMRISLLLKNLLFAFGLWGLTPLWNSGTAFSEEVKIWEFSPYEVEVWYAFDGGVSASSLAQQELIRQLQAELERTFRAAWRVTTKPLPPEFAATILRDFDSYNLEAITASELNLVASQKHEAAKTVRTFEAALESSGPIYCTAATKQLVERAAIRLGLTANSPTLQLLAKCTIEAEGTAAMQEKLKSGDIAIALLPRATLPSMADTVRPIVTPLPWQTDNLFRERDKLFFLVLGRDGEDITIKARELDCPMQFLGPSMHASTKDWNYASRLATATIVRAFAPVARVEDAETKSAMLRLRAGGLIVDDDNPAAIVLGDVMQPIVRRDDRNGVPDLLEPLSWTFAAITASDGVKLEANVYTYSGGPGLQGRKNRRTQRMLLKVRPKFDSTDIELLVRDNGNPQAGSFVYRRDLLTDEFELLGRTDWRGRFTIPAPKEFGGILPEKIRYERALAKREAENKALVAAAQADSPAVDVTATEEPATDAPASDASADAPASSEPDNAVIPLRAALTQIYIKNGDEVLAKLPMVPGLKAIETAQLKDDSRRLRAEAFVRGFQAEILDLVGLRNLLAARIQLHLKNGKLDQAKATVDELRRLRNYTEMAEELQAIQRRMLDEQDGPVPVSAKNRIDKMFQTTRDMLQKFMQDNLLSESERAVAAARDDE